MIHVLRHRSQSPLGPYTYVGDINPAAHPRLADSAADAGQGAAGVLQDVFPPEGAFTGRGGQAYSAGGDGGLPEWEQGAGVGAGADGHQLVAAASASLPGAAVYGHSNVSPFPPPFSPPFPPFFSDNMFHFLGDSSPPVRETGAAQHTQRGTFFHLGTTRRAPCDMNG